MRRSSGIGPLLAFLTIAAVAIGLVIVLRRGPDALPRPSSPPPATTAVPSVATGEPSASPIALSSASPEPVALDPPESPEPPPGGCLTTSTIRDFATSTIGAIARSSQAIVVASVVEVGAARWDTIDGRIPARHDRDAFHVVRLVRIRVEEVLAGRLGADVVAFPGGTIGCWQFLMDSTPSDIAPGDRYVLVVRGAPHDPRLGGLSVVSETWWFERGRVRARAPGLLTLAALRAAIAAP